MNRTSRTDEPYEGEGLNQSPNPLSNDLTTNQDLNGIANTRTQRQTPDGRISGILGQAMDDDTELSLDVDRYADPRRRHGGGGEVAVEGERKGGGRLRYLRDAIRRPASEKSDVNEIVVAGEDSDGFGPPAGAGGRTRKDSLERIRHTLFTFAKFVGPGFLISVAYIDPGNYATDIAAGASNRFRLLFIVLMSNLFAIFLQSLAIKLGTVSGLNLAEACREFLPRWVNYILYVLAEIAIIATDMAEVIGTAIALNLLNSNIPLVAGCAISILDVMIILIFYRPEGSMNSLRGFEYFVAVLVLAVVICFCIQLSLISNTTPGEVFKGYIPNNVITESDGLYQACGILGATVMPHSLYLGSGIVQSRLKDYDARQGLLPAQTTDATSVNMSDDGKSGDKTFYIPSLKAIRHSLKYTYAENAISLFTFALFVNSAILIVAGASLYNNPDALDADIFGIHDLLGTSLNQSAATIFALALLFSGVSAGIVCTIAGQMVSEGALRWRMKPWVRRLVTRSISITPSIIIAGAAGRDKLMDALEGSQVVLSVVLPFVSAPLIWFTCFNRYMTVRPGMARFLTEGQDTFVITEREVDAEEQQAADGYGDGPLVKMANAWWVCALGVAIWLIIVVMNIANLVLLGLGK